ncbi:hypothetical protein [Bosea sp. 2RAB26]|uniref:hypothetical protein n=1 Tax=Bosea sp. 2RAB26 TaxID=3237476 RepID=UPI003F92015B
MSAYPLPSPPAAEDCHGKVVLCRMVLTIGSLVKQGQKSANACLVLPTWKERLPALVMAFTAALRR